MEQAKKAINSIEEDIKKKHKRLSKAPTDKKDIKDVQGYDYVKVGKFITKANEEYPIWSWKIDETEIIYIDSFQVVKLSNEKVITRKNGVGEKYGETIITETIEKLAVIRKPISFKLTGTLTFYDGGMKREFSSTFINRIHYKKGVLELVDPGNDAKAANMNAIKKAMQVAMSFFADVYKYDTASIPEHLVSKLMKLAEDVGGVELGEDMERRIADDEINNSNINGAILRLTRQLDQKDSK